MPHVQVGVLPKTLLAKSHEKRSTRVSQALLEAARLDVAAAHAYLKTRPEGLTTDEAEARLREHGQNVLAKDRRPSLLRLFWRAVRNPLVILLAVLATLSVATGDTRAALMMLLMIALSVGLKLAQEAKASSAAAKLRAMISVRASVLRGGKLEEIAVARLVPGDIVQLTAGDMIPGDVRLVVAKDLFVIQGSLTGESFPVEKFVVSRGEQPSSPLELANGSYAERRPFGEASLPSHLKQKGEKDKEGKEESGSSSYVPPEPEKDKQLQYGIRLLRGDLAGPRAKRSAQP